MSGFTFSKVDHYRINRKSTEDIIDLKFPSEIDDSTEETLSKPLLVFIIEDDPHFLQILNTHFSKLKLKTSEEAPLLEFKIRNFATGMSAIQNLELEPDIILLNYYINHGLPNALSGRDTLEQIKEKRPHQKVIVLNDLSFDISHAFVENGLRDYIIQDQDALNHLNALITDILKDVKNTEDSE